MYVARFFQKICVPLSNKNSASISVLKQCSAYYSVKRQHRRPTKVYYPDGERTTEPGERTTEPDESISGRVRKRPSKSDEILGVIELEKNISSRNERFQKNIAVESEQTDKSDNESDHDSENEVVGTPFVRLGDTDRSFDRRMVKVQSKKQREKNNMIMLEGKRLIQDAISAGVIPVEIFFTKKSLVADLAMPPGKINLYKMPYNYMKKWSPLQTNPGIIAFCKIPKNMLPKPKNAIPLTVICDNVREPGNMGAIIRTVAGVGCMKVLLTKGCVDIWDSKVLRSGSGAHFHVPLESGLTWEQINQKISSDASIYIAHHNEENEAMEGKTIPTIPYFSVNYSRLSDIVVVVGGETEGVSDDAIHFARYRDGLKINIPLSNNIDSLNVGAAISTILFEVKRQFIINNRNESYFNEVSFNDTNNDKSRFENVV